MRVFEVCVNGTNYTVQVNEPGVVAAVTQTAAAAPRPVAAPAPVAAAPAPVAAPVAAAPKAAPAKPASGGETMCAPMPGKILTVKAKAGDAVKSGQVLLILEAMKMENEICAPRDCTIADVCVTAGQSVGSGEPMVVLG